MRLSGVVDDVRRLGPHDHVCWGFTDPAVFRAEAKAFLAEGAAMGQQVWYAGVRADVEVAPLGAAHPLSPVTDPATQVQIYAQATADALAAGFTGLRVAVDATDLVRTDAQLDAFARYEHLVDRFMTTEPFSSMCAYDATELGEDTLAQVECMHPATGQDVAQFRLHASTRSGCVAALAGELDIACAGLLTRALERADLRPDSAGELVLEATGLTFIDHGRLLDLVGYARQQGATLVLYTDEVVPRRLVELLGVDGVRIEGTR
jgi:anti-anti-sigma regulatory factor